MIGKIEKTSIIDSKQFNKVKYFDASDKPLADDYAIGQKEKGSEVVVLKIKRVFSGYYVLSSDVPIDELTEFLRVEETPIPKPIKLNKHLKSKTKSKTKSKSKFKSKITQKHKRGYVKSAILNFDGKITPSAVKKIAKQTCTSEDNVRHHIKDLKSQGINRNTFL